ncbi:DNA-binding protein [Psychrobacillus sp. MER TA 171]|nr:DNA-binding protein [Psychrobacillus sp. MER TA 171]
MASESNLLLSQEKQLNEIIANAIKNAINNHQFFPKDWMNLQEGAAYANVSLNTFKSFRLKGLKICEIDGVKRVSKEEIDKFLKSHSY